MKTVTGKEETLDTTTAVVQVRTAAFSTRYAWWVVALLTLANVLSFLDRQIVSLLVAPIRRDLDISDTQMSLLMGFSFALFYTFFGIPLGRLADVANRRNLIATGIVFWSLMTAVCGLARNFTHFLLGRIGVGIGEASLAPSAFSLVGDYFPPARRATALSVYAMGIYIGAGLAMLLGGLLLKFLPGREAFVLPLLGAVRPWQLIFLILGGAGILFSLTLWTVREPARYRNTKAISEEKDRAEDPMSLRAVFAYVRKHRAAFACHNLGFAFLALSGYGTSAWLPTLFMRRFGWTAAEFGLTYGTITAIVGTLGTLLGGVVADRMLRRGCLDATLRIGLFAAVAALVPGYFCLFAPSGQNAAFWLAPLALCTSMPLGVGAASLQQLVPPAMRGQVFALFLFVVTLIGLGLGPTAVALLTDYVFRSDQAVHAALAVVGLTAHLAAALLLWQGLAPFRRSVSHGDRV